MKKAIFAAIVLLLTFQCSQPSKPVKDRCNIVFLKYAGESSQIEFLMIVNDSVVYSSSIYGNTRKFIDKNFLKKLEDTIIENVKYFKYKNKNFLVIDSTFFDIKRKNIIDSLTFSIDMDNLKGKLLYKNNRSYMDVKSEFELIKCEYDYDDNDILAINYLFELVIRNKEFKRKYNPDHFEKVKIYFKNRDSIISNFHQARPLINPYLISFQYLLIYYQAEERKYCSTTKWR